ncbi:MAG: hypothetical protein ACE5JG_06905 [Planctomycetota bacterium]
MEVWEALLSVGAIVFLFAVLYAAVRNALVRRKLVCPRTHQVADVEVLHRGFRGDGRPLSVRSCSLLDEPRRVDCPQDCLESTS